MNPVKLALDRIRFTIPDQILTEVFKSTYQGHYQAPISVEAIITNKVIKPRVMIDTNLVGGRIAVIPLFGLYPDVVDNGLIFYIPPDRTMYQSIMSVLSVNYLPNQNLYYDTYQATQGSDRNNVILQAGNRVGLSMDNLPIVSTAIVDVIGENTILIQNVNPTMAHYALRCIMANDDNLNNLSPRSIPAFQKLCELAVKSYIYNNMIVKMDQAFLQGGMELGVFKSIIEGYSDTEEQYQTHLREVWRAVAFMNDTPSYDRLIRMQVSGGL